MPDNMTDNRLLERIIEQTRSDDFWHRGVEHHELKTVKTDHDVLTANRSDEKIVVHEGSFDRWVDVRAVNFAMVLLWDPQYAFELLREKAPNNGKDAIDRYISVELINAPSPQLKEDLFDVARPKGYVEDACTLAAFLANDDRKENYTYRLFRGLAISEVKLNMGTNPRSHTKEFYGWEGPVRIIVEAQEKVSDAVAEGTSAAETNW